MNKGDRKLWVDWLNITACICVVLMHCTNKAIHNYSGTIDATFVIGLFSHTFAYWPVPVFIMLSGCNLFGNMGGVENFYIRRFKRTFIPFVFWSLFYYIVNYHRIIPIGEFAEKFINGKICGAMWFFIPLFAVYLSMPFVNLFVENATKRMLRLYLIIGFVFISVLPCFLEIAHIQYTNLFPIGMNFVFVAVSGYAIVRDDWFHNHRKFVYKVGILASLIHIAVLVLILFYFHKSSRIYLHCIYPTNMLIATSVFLWFCEQRWDVLMRKIHLSSETLMKVSSCSLGIYLLHPLIITLSERFNLYLSNPYLGFLLIYM